MKNLLLSGFVFVFISCSKTKDQQAVSPQLKVIKESCNFGSESFNLTKRKPVIEGAYNNRRGNGNTTPPPPPPPTSNPGVILLDFDGHLVSGTSWNCCGDINCAPANLLNEEKANILNRVSNDYSPFNITVTTDESIYNAAPTNRKTRVIITETWEWFGQTGGTSLVNSFTDGSSAPCFVFSSLLNYSSKKIAEASSHEAGHTLGLRHQSTYSNCIKISEYNSGVGSGETGWAPIMGNSYGQNLSLWHSGPNSVSCNTFQNDAAAIAAVVGFRTDDFSNAVSGATSLITSQDGIINTSTDIDFFSLNISTVKTVSLTPFNTGIANAGANTDLILRVYNTQGTLISSVDYIDVLNSSITLNPGSYFVSAGTIANAYTSVYGMLGRYTISVN